MKVIVNFGEKKVVVPCGTTGELFIRDLIQLAITKFCKLSSSTANPSLNSTLNSEQVQLRLNNGAVVDPDDRVCDVVDDREELFAIFDHSSPGVVAVGQQTELTSSMTSSNLSTSLSEHERPMSRSYSSSHRHEVIVTDADLRSRSLRVKTDSSSNLQTSQIHHDRSGGMFNFQHDDQTGDNIFSIVLPKENSPLGIHVIPYNNQNEEQVHGLLLQTIESDGRIKRQGILELNDRIIEINRINIEQCSFDKAQQIFRHALLEAELELRIVRSTKKSPPSSSFYLNQPPELPQKTKRLGKLIKIILIKGPDGLGFKLASRDNPTGAANPIYVKTIFGKGAAIEDGRLRTGDRLLMVNSIDVTQMSLQDTVGLLRETRVGDTIQLCVSRQHDGSLPKDLLNDEVASQMMTFDIPLRDTSSAGLGITIKGKTSIVDGQSMDLGIFVKSILTGGAAHRDTRLRSNDQILVINDYSLVNLSNLEAANILHDAVRKEIHPGYIKITVSRLCHPEFDIPTVQETDLSPMFSTPVNDENELDLTTFVPSVNRKAVPSQQDSKSMNPPLPSRDRPTLNEKQNQEENSNGSVNPFERETPFRQSVSEKRRLNQPANKQIVQWKQQSFHEDRASSIDRKQIRRGLTDSNKNPNGNVMRSSSFESLPRPIGEERDEEQKRQAKLRNRACNDSFRQAVDKSYAQTHQRQQQQQQQLSTPVLEPTQQLTEKTNKNEKQRFRFSNLFITKSKRKENQDEKPIQKSTIIHYPSPSRDPSTNLFLPPPTPFSSRDESKSNNTERSQTGYQPHHFELNSKQSEQQSRLIHEFSSKISSGKTSLSINQSSSHSAIPRQFLSSNINGTQSLRSNHHPSRSTYTVQPAPFNPYSPPMDFPLNPSQRSMIYPSSSTHLKFENPANV